jgi:hypothetical protein
MVGITVTVLPEALPLFHVQVYAGAGGGDVAVRVIVSPAHMESPDGLMLTAGVRLTIIVTTAESEHPFISVPTTV